MSTTNPPAEILQQTTAFLSEVLSQSDLRQWFSTFLQKLPPSDEITLKPLKLASETLENALTTTNPSIKSSSLRLAEKLLLSYPKNPFSSFLLSLIYSLFNRPVEAAISLFDVFETNPSLARLEIAPLLFQELFLIHLLPVLEWYNERRSSILSNVTKNLTWGYDSDDHSVVVSPSRLLKNMNGNQASALKDLEKDYEDILDENCKVFAVYFREVLQNKDANQIIDPPAVVLQSEESEKFENKEVEKVKRDYSMENGRYNPIWVEEDQPVEINNSNRHKSLSKFPSFVPERVSPKVLTKQGSSKKSESSINYNLDSELESFSSENLSHCYLSDSEAEQQENFEKVASSYSRQSRNMVQGKLGFAESSSYPDPPMEDIDNLPGVSKLTLPKDFVCPITTHIFDDPVTLETGQTYERKAIQEWIDRGNSTCPITRQKLQSSMLPKTNYVLKRLIASWLELNPGANPKSESLQPENHPKVIPVRRSASPNCVISQATMEGKVSQLRLAITNLCTSEVLKNSEMAVLQIETLWQESHMEVDIQNMMSKPAVISGFMEILFNSVDPRVLSAAVFLLSELGFRDSNVIQTLTRVDSDVQCIASLFKRGLLEAVVLVHLLRPSAMSLVDMDVVDSLLTVLKTKEEDLLNMCVKPKTASLLLLGQLLKSAEEVHASEIARTLVSENAVECIMRGLEGESREEKILAVSILCRCILEDGNCRNRIADKAELCPVLDSMIGANGEECFEIAQFLSELVKLDRRTFNEQILHIIRDEGNFNTMHMLLIHLQTLPPEKCPVVAGLLLQLDLLVEPRKMSMFREEAIDTLIACLKNSDHPSAQIAAAKTIVSLQGRFSDTGEPLARALLLSRTGLNRSKSRIKKDQLASISDEIQENKEEEKSAEEWEGRMAFALVSHEFGLIFETLAEGLRSRSAELCSTCFVVATWLVHMLNILPDTGVRGAARGCLLKLFVSIFKTAKDSEDKALSMLALSSFCSDSEGLQDMTAYVKDILKGLRELKKSSSFAIKMLKVLSEEHESSIDTWNHKELIQGDCSTSGEVLSIVCFKDKIYSGHSDGRIKVWTIKGGSMHLMQESQEHTKAVTSLTILQSVERLYSGSLDRTVRVWSIDGKGMHCGQVYEMKDHVNNLVVSNSIACFTPQGAGIKVHSWSGVTKLLNQQRYVKCLTLVQGKLYCGCLDSSIQEIDLATGTISSIQGGSRRLLSKSNPVYAVHASDGLLYSASSPLDGAAVKIWRTSNYSMVGSLPSTSEVRSVAVSADLIYLGCKGGLVEVWCKKKHSKVEALHAGTSAKVLCMALTSNEDILVIGTSDGKIQAWELS